MLSAEFLTKKIDKLNFRDIIVIVKKIFKRSKMKQEFKAESKELLNLMIHSIYSNKDIFLRELISNASDALDKEHFARIQSKTKSTDALEIKIKTDKDNRTITISDSGIGMNEADLINNLGTIAHSGTKEFIKNLKTDEQIDSIGQFGVGFYASFIVADKVEVLTKKENDNAYLWSSDGTDSFEIVNADKDSHGTEITLYLKAGEDFDKYADSFTVESIIKTHSDYVKYPILLEKMVTIPVDTDDDNQEEAHEELQFAQVNSQVALWKKTKSEITDEEYEEFYQKQFMQFTKPLKVMHKVTEGMSNNNLLLYIPSSKPFDYNTPNYKNGIDLYSKGILIDNNVDYLIPEHFNFVRGLIDSNDLDLNISREILQKDQKVSRIQKFIEKTITKTLTSMLKKQREDYNQFYDNFGRTLMFGVYNEFGKNADKLKDLIMFKTNKSDDYVTLLEYTQNNIDQDKIYYLAGNSIEAINAMPIMESIKEKEIEILYLTNDIDEFALQVLAKYEDKDIISVLNADLQSETEKEDLKQLNEQHQELLTKVKASLSDKVVDVKLTNRLKTSAASIINAENISIEQEKLLMQMPDANLNLNKILEINPNHEFFKLISKTENINDYAQVLYNQARLVEGLEIDNPKEYSDLLFKLLSTQK